VLWDIDRTLIASGGVGRAAFQAAFEETTGQPMGTMADPSGQTEPVIFSRTLEAHGIRDPGDYFDRFARLEASAYRDRAAELRQRGRVLPGVEDVLAAGGRTPEISQTVLTGNTKDGAAIKLGVFGLSHFLDLEFGAFGDDHADRSRLVPLAQQRASVALGREFGADETVIIGDTVHDIAAGVANGVRVIAVATGECSATVLRESGADEVFDDLTDTAAVLKAILA
jgi:phosphoglycolate phosphatase-like HAD superfamily hydrolase